MSKVVSLSDYRKPKVDIKINCNLDSKKACELIDTQTLLALAVMKIPSVSVDGETIYLNVDDIFRELDQRD